MASHNSDKLLRSWAREYTREIVIAALWVGATLIIGILSSITHLSLQENILVVGLLCILDFFVVLVSLVLRSHSQTQVLIAGALSREQRGLDAMVRDAGSELNELTYAAIDDSYSLDIVRARQMVEEGKYYIPRSEWYLEVIRLCRAFRGKHGELMAISAYNIEDFMKDESAKKYLSANSEALLSGTRIRRLFILGGEDMKSRDIHYVLQQHDEQLVSPRDTKSPAEGSGVKWILRRHTRPIGVQDFALFYPYVLVRQAPGGQQLEVSQIKSEINGAAEDFRKLWEKQTAKTVTELSEVGDNHK